VGKKSVTQELAAASGMLPAFHKQLEPCRRRAGVIVMRAFRDVIIETTHCWISRSASYM